MSERSPSPRKGKRILPEIPRGTMFSPAVKSVTFNTETVETSIGGTETIGWTKQSPLSASNSLDMGYSRNVNRGDNSVDLSLSLDLDGDSDGHFQASLNIKNDVDRTRSVTSLEDKENFIAHLKNKRRNTLDDNCNGSQFKTPPPVSGSLSRRYTLDEKILGTPECFSAVQMDSLKYELFNDESKSSARGEDSSSVTVAVRVRPYSQRETADTNVRCVVSMSGNETTVVADNGHVHRFTFDYSFWSFDDKSRHFSDQEDVYSNLAKPLLGKAFEGYNTCLFAYGQTGSGKSYSIMGHGSDVGIIPRFCAELFDRASVTCDMDQVKISVEISFFEIYNEKIHDLLASSKEKGGKKPTLKVREHPVLGPYVEGLSTFVVNSFEDIEGWITLGNKNRATAATGMNDKSSRSHSVFTLVLTQTKTEAIEGQQHDHAITSKINLVDLAGSERQSQAQTSGERLREGANINKSLMTLGKVISLLSEQSTGGGKRKKIYIPYRDSVLTWLLKESLGGNSKTAMIATISPAHHHTEESLSTLRYPYLNRQTGFQDARSIVNTAHVNEDPKSKIIRELRCEIERLRLQGGGGGVPNMDGSLEIAMLRERLMSKEKEMEEMSISWQKRLRRSEAQKVEEEKVLERSGVAFKINNKLPNLVNLNEDPQLSEMLLYIIKDGQTHIGRMSADSKHDIQLSGALIADNHCVITNIESEVSIMPIGDAPTYINGIHITEATSLHHGDRVILGGDHYFRFNNPAEPGMNKKTSSGPAEVRDFEFAKQELVQVQEARLQAEYEEATKKAQEEMLLEIERAKKEAEEELNSQRTDYEDKLAEMEKVLKDRTVKMEESKQEADDAIQKLKKQKMMLEQEVLAGRKRQQMEAEIAHKAATKIATGKSRLLELLEMEKQKVALQLEEYKQRRNESTPLKRQRIDSSSGKADLYKVALLLREANKICQLLKKHTIFGREDFLEDDKMKTTCMIKVTNTRLNVCTFWSVPKFEDKLMQMRDLYQNEGDSSADDEVFSDPADLWEKDNRSDSPNASPKMRIGWRRSFSSPLVQQSSQNKGMHTFFSVQSLVTTSKLVKINSISLFLLDLQSFSFEESIADKMLNCCQRLKQALMNVRNVFSISAESNQDLSQMNITIMLNCLEVLTNTCSVWSIMYESLESSLIRELICQMRDHIKLTGNQMVLFFQGFENSIDSLTQESSSKILDSILAISKLCGELALATDMQMLSLEEMRENTTVNSASLTIGHDVCQSFLAGCDIFIDKTLQGAIRTLEDCETQAQILSDMAVDDLSLGDVPQNVEIAISTTKVLLLKCQEVQVEVDTSMRESIETKPVQFYNLSYRRSQGLISHISNLTDGATLLLQAAKPIVEGGVSNLKKICHCSEKLQKASMHLMTASGKDRWKSLTRDNCELDLSVLSDSQNEQLEYAAQEVKVATETLADQVWKVLETSKESSEKSRGKQQMSD
ncbi:hypothetical protein ScPMuIL_011624 [Solemya velum]